MRRIPTGLCVFFAFAVFLSTWGTSLAIESQEVTRIAQAQKDLFLAPLMVEYVKRYGPPKDSLNLTFGSLDELASALRDAELNETAKRIELEAPFQVYTINANKIMSATGQADLTASIVPMDEWFVPVRIHGESVAMLTVGQIEGKWQVVGSSLGDFGKRMNQVPSTFSPAKGEGKYVMVNAAHIDFISVEQNGESKIFLFPYGEKQLDMDVNRKDPSGLYEAEDVLPAVAQRVLERGEELD